MTPREARYERLGVTPPARCPVVMRVICWCGALLGSEAYVGHLSECAATKDLLQRFVAEQELDAYKEKGWREREGVQRRKRAAAARFRAEQAASQLRNAVRSWAVRDGIPSTNGAHPALTG